MKQFPIPVVSDGPIGPGSQSDEGEGFNYLPIPREVETFAMPQVPQSAEAEHLAGARDVLAQFVETMLEPGSLPIELLGLPEGVIEVLNQTLGEGEVAIRIVAQNGVRHDVRIQETVFAGVWRQRHVAPDGTLLHDFLIAAPIPPIAIEFAEATSLPALPPVDVPAGAMNAPALLTEVGAAVRGFKPAQEARVINLTLLPLTPDDHTLLEHAFPRGSVAVLSRGFGNCRVSSTQVRHLWRVQYFNSMQTLILNTLEVTRVPEVALAAEEDLADSHERLLDLISWMSESAEAT
ncbi:MAG: hydrogenase expression/formation protein [Betaproteobacteria bacterium]|jgi:hydrogenase-1 operon protein HyaF|nr:hydrogenase expression/formation protein [Burkholderiales bacterium]